MSSIPSAGEIEWSKLPESQVPLDQYGENIHSGKVAVQSIYDLLALSVYEVELCTNPLADENIPEEGRTSAQLMRRIIQRLNDIPADTKSETAADTSNTDRFHWIEEVLQVVSRIRADLGNSSLFDIAILDEEAERYRVTEAERAAVQRAVRELGFREQAMLAGQAVETDIGSSDLANFVKNLLRTQFVCDKLSRAFGAQMPPDLTLDNIIQDAETSKEHIAPEAYQKLEAWISRHFEAYMTETYLHIDEITEQSPARDVMHEMVARKSEGGAWVDIAGGPGLDMAFLHQHAYSLLHTDGTASTLGIARQVAEHLGLNNIKFMPINYNLGLPELANAEYDAAYSHLGNAYCLDITGYGPEVVINEHRVTGQRFQITEMMRVTKEGGQIFFTFVPPPGELDMVKAAQEAMPRFAARVEGRIKALGGYSRVIRAFLPGAAPEERERVLARILPSDVAFAAKAPPMTKLNTALMAGGLMKNMSGDNIQTFLKNMGCDDIEVHADVGPAKLIVCAARVTAVTKSVLAEQILGKPMVLPEKTKLAAT